MKKQKQYVFLTVGYCFLAAGTAGSAVYWWDRPVILKATFNIFNMIAVAAMVLGGIILIKAENI